MPGVFAALGELQRRGFRLVIVTNQDGLGTPGYPQRGVSMQVQEFMLDAFASQGVHFDAVFVCPHRPRQSLRLPQACDGTRRGVSCASRRSILQRKLR